MEIRNESQEQYPYFLKKSLFSLSLRTFSHDDDDNSDDGHYAIIITSSDKGDIQNSLHLMRQAEIKTSIKPNPAPIRKSKSRF